MNTTRYIITLMAIISSISTPYCCALSLYPTNMEMRLFGNQDASPAWQQKIHAVLHDFDVPDADTVPVKQINARTRLPFSSFTWHGIWINEEALNRISHAEQTFTAYHEAAHYALRHQNKIIGYTGLATLLASAITYAGTSYLFGKIPTCYWMTGATTLITLFGSLHQMSRKYELEADVAAAKKLYELNEKEIVTQYTLKLLNKAEPASMWFPRSQARAYAIIEAIKTMGQLMEVKNDDTKQKA